MLTNPSAASPAISHDPKSNGGRWLHFSYLALDLIYPSPLTVLSFVTNPTGFQGQALDQKPPFTTPNHQIHSSRLGKKHYYTQSQSATSHIKECTPIGCASTFVCHRSKDGEIKKQNYSILTRQCILRTLSTDPDPDPTRESTLQHPQRLRDLFVVLLMKVRGETSAIQEDS